LDAPDTLEVAPSVREMDWEGSIVPFTIRARGSWTASAPDEWLEILPPASGSGTDYIRVSAGENAGGFRQGSVVVTAPGHRPESVTVHVNQAASPHSAPEAPSHLMVTTVYWDVAGVTWRDRSNNETKFQVERRRENDQWLLRAEPSAGAIIFVDSLVEANTLYSYRVRSANDYGASEPSNAVSFLTNSAPVTLVVNDPPLESLLSPHGDIDWFKLPITSAGQFTIETTLRGLQNSQIWLFGPDNRETEIAYDNDSGYGLASKIAENLNIGIYYVRVAGVPDSTMGNYFITARPEGR